MAIASRAFAPTRPVPYAAIGLVVALVALVVGRPAPLTAGPSGRSADARVDWAREVHNGPVTALAASATGRLVVSADGEGLVRARGADGRHLRTLGGEPARSYDTVWSAAVSPDGRYAAVGRRSGAVSLWDVKDGRALPGAAPADSAATVVALGRRGRTVVGRWDGSVAFWDQASRRSSALAHGSGWVTALALDRAAARAAAAWSGGRVALLDVTTQDVRWSADAGEPVYGLVLSPDGALLWGVGTNVLLSWRLDTGEPLASRPIDGVGQSVAISDDGRSLVVATADAVHTWRLGPAGPRDQLTHRLGWARLAVATGTGMVVTGDEDGMLRAYQSPLEA